MSSGVRVTAGQERRAVRPRAQQMRVARQALVVRVPRVHPLARWQCGAASRAAQRRRAARGSCGFALCGMVSASATSSVRRAVAGLRTESRQRVGVEQLGCGWQLRRWRGAARRRGAGGDACSLERALAHVVVGTMRPKALHRATVEETNSGKDAHTHAQRSENRWRGQQTRAHAKSGLN